MSIQTRQPAGTPTGGQFTQLTRPETGVALPAVDRDQVVAVMMRDLVDAYAVSSDSQGVGYTLGDAEEVATIGAAAALGLPDDQEPDEPSVKAAWGAITDTLTPDEQTKFWTGADAYWTDDLPGLCEAMIDAVHAHREVTGMPVVPHILQP